MNKEFLNRFILQIEELKKADGNTIVYDERGSYHKAAYIEAVISEAMELIKYGESEIALENMLENLNEVGIMLDIDTVILARKAFGETISPYNDDLLETMTCK
ncbi:MAG: hypothetical protein NC240_07330 [Clostridium sp.]|nr:hypothetical protein [Clostridium sp.]